MISFCCKIRHIFRSFKVLFHLTSHLGENAHAKLNQIALNTRISYDRKYKWANKDIIAVIVSSCSAFKMSKMSYETYGLKIKVPIKE